MAGLPYLKFYPGDYFLDTGHLTCLQHGIYTQLIWRYFTRGGPLPDDDAYLANLVRLGPREWKRNRESVAAFFQVSGGFWSHRRVDAELTEAEAKVLQTQSAGRTSARRRLNGRLTDVQRPSNDSEEEEEEPSSIDIELGRAGARRSSSDGKNGAKLKPQFEFAGEETIMTAVRKDFAAILPSGEYALLFCDPQREIAFVSEEGRLVAYCVGGFAHSLVRDHEFRLSKIAQQHGFKEAWIREQPQGERS